MPDLKEVIERLEAQLLQSEEVVRATDPGTSVHAYMDGKSVGLIIALSALKPLLEKNDG